MKYVFFIGLAFSTLFGRHDHERIYPPGTQTLEGSTVYYGDRHGDFAGDQVAILSDGSEWKIHPDCNRTFEFWDEGDRIRVSKRNDHYWFSRQHHFLLINDAKGEDVKVMLIKHKREPLKIVQCETYHKSKGLSFKPVVRFNLGGGSGISPGFDLSEQPKNPRKILILSDGSAWVIKEHLEAGKFCINTEVYVGSQGSQSNSFYDFILISGSEREAISTIGRPQSYP